jgi:hypothetical protein
MSASHSRLASTNFEPARKELFMTKRADFRKYYHDAHATDLLTEREKKLIGIAVAIVRNCQL